MDIPVGLKGSISYTVGPEGTASALVSSALPVFATPFLVALMEYAALSLVQPLLEEGQTTVGTGVDIVHVSPTPVGLTVRAEAEVTAVDRRALTFRVTVRDELGEVGSGTHTRFIIDRERFMEKANAKRAEWEERSRSPSEGGSQHG